MTLLITVFAAVISTAIWNKNAPEDKIKVNIVYNKKEDTELQEKKQ